MPAPLHKPESDSYLAGYEQVTGTARVTWFLNQLLTSRALLTINFDGEQEQFTSAILEVDIRNNLVILDGLMPDSGNRLFASNQVFQVSGWIDGKKVKSAFTCMEVQEQNGNTCIAAHIPKLIYYRQRRDSHRIQSPMHFTFRVMLDFEDNHTEEGLLRDLSHGGAQVLLHTSSDVIANSTLLECAIQLPKDETLYCTAIVCYSDTSGSNNGVRAGLRFLGITPHQQRTIERSTAFLEQQLARKLAK